MNIENLEKANKIQKRLKNSLNKTAVICSR